MSWVFSEEQHEAGSWNFHRATLSNEMAACKDNRGAAVVVDHTRGLSRKRTVRHPVALSRADLARVGFFVARVEFGKGRNRE
jgi:hypothetical protein